MGCEEYLSFVIFLGWFFLLRLQGFESQVSQIGEVDGPIPVLYGRLCYIFRICDGY